MTGTSTNAATEPAGAARFQAASAALQAANAAKPKPLEKPVASSTGTTTASAGATPAPTKTFVDELKEAPEDAMNTLESRITELEAVVHRLASAADGTHTGVVAWIKKVGARLEAAAKKL